MHDYQHRCTQCFKIYECKPCLDPKRHGICSKMPYEYRISSDAQNVSASRKIDLYFCNSDCFMECMVLMEAVKTAIERMLKIFGRLEEIVLTAQTAEEADRMMDELFEEIDQERRRMMEELGSDWEKSTSEEDTDVEDDPEDTDHEEDRQDDHKR
jgi:hypothetical protein